MSLQSNKAVTTQEPQGRSRRISDHEYGLHREKILRLYLKERMSREEVIHILAEEDKFSLSPKQFKHILQRWGVRKNIKSSEREDILRQKQHQERRGLTEPINYSVYQFTTEPCGPALKRQRIHASSPSREDVSFRTPDNRLQCPSHNDEDTWGPENFIAPTDIDKRQMILGDFSRFGTPTTLQELSPLSQTGYTVDQDFETQGLHIETLPFISTSTSGRDSIASYSTPFVPHAATVRVFPPYLDIVEQCALHSANCLAPHNDLPANILEERKVPGSKRRFSGETSSLLHGQGVLHSWPVVSQSSPQTRLPEINPSVEGPGLGYGYSTERDPRAVVRLILNLSSLCSEFLDYGHQWHYPYEAGTRYSSRAAKLYPALKSEWFQVAINHILYCYFDASAQMMRQGKAVTLTQNPANTYSTRNFLQTSVSAGNTSNRSKSVFSRGVRRIALVARESEESDTIIFRFEDPSVHTRATGVDTSICLLHISYLPRKRTSTSGITLTLQGPSDIHHRPGLCTALRTFNTIPKDSEAIRCIKRNDPAGLQKLFDLRRASPLDVDPDGCSLLCYAIDFGCLEVFHLLLNVGASLEDVWSGRDVFSTLAVEFAIWSRTSSWPRISKSFVKMTELVCAKYLNAVPLLEWALFALSYFYCTSTVEDIPDLTAMVGCLKGVFDLEFRDSREQTLLLHSSMLNKSIVLIAIIANGANLRATDRYGRGALHSALCTRSFTICPNACRKWRCNSHHQCTCPSEPHPHDEHYHLSSKNNPLQTDISFLEQTLLVLLNARCDPNVRDIYGLTPSDYARRNEECWMIWQTALQETGYAYDEESGECYETYLEMI